MENVNLNPQELADLVRHSPLFDEQWYKQEYPEIEYHEEGNPDPAFHYANYGYKEQRLPSPLFDGNYYSALHHLTDVNPLVHYVKSGATGTTYRVSAREPEVLLKVSLQLPLTPSERVLYLESNYKDSYGREIDLALRTPEYLQEKLCYLRAFAAGKTTEEQEAKVAAEAELLDGQKLPAKAEALGVAAEVCPKPDMVFAGFNEVDLNKLPRFFRLKYNGASTYQLLVTNKERLKVQDFNQQILLLERLASNVVSGDKLGAQAQVKPEILVYSQDPIVKAASTPNSKEGIKYPSHVELWYIAGELKYVLSRNNLRALSLFDQNFTLQATRCVERFGTQLQAHQAVQQEKPVCFDKLCEVGSKFAAGQKFVRVSFTVDGENFVLDEVGNNPVPNLVLLHNDVALKAGALLDVSDIKA